MSIKLYAAPLQGYTRHVYRQAHARFAGGVDAYFTPFLRWEHGEVRHQDLADLPPAAACPYPCVPQIIARDADEAAHLCDALQDLGYQHININMGCPFPPQVHRGRGCGLLLNPTQVEAILRETASRTDCTFSVKMRPGWNHPEEGLSLLPLLNHSHITHITLHPRLGRQQYKGMADVDLFQRFLSLCHKPLIYNGDISSPQQAWALMERFPTLHGLMIGRGILTHPLLAHAIRQQPDTTTPPVTTDTANETHCILMIHNEIYQHTTTHLQGPAQILPHLHSFWEYHQDLLPKQTYKHLIRSTTLQQYNEALHLWQKTL